MGRSKSLKLANTSYLHGGRSWNILTQVLSDSPPQGTLGPVVAASWRATTVDAHSATIMAQGKPSGSKKPVLAALSVLPVPATQPVMELKVLKPGKTLE